MEEDSHSFSSYSYNKRAGKQKKKKKTAKMFGADFTWYHPLQQPQKEKDIHKDCIYIYIYINASTKIELSSSTICSRGTTPHHRGPLPHYPLSFPLFNFISPFYNLIAKGRGREKSKGSKRSRKRATRASCKILTLFLSPQKTKRKPCKLTSHTRK